MARNYFFKEACKLQLRDKHEEIEQFDVYYNFKSSVRRQCVPTDNTSFLGSSHAIWYVRNVIYGNQWQSMFRLDKKTGKKIWTQFSAASVSEAVKDLRRFRKENSLPVVFLSGGTEGINKGGHCYVVIIQTEPTSKMYIKDSMGEDWATVREKPRQIAKALGIKEIDIIHALPTETTSQCILEAYRFIGEVLDGKYRSGFDELPSRTYDVIKKKYTSVNFVTRAAECRVTYPNDKLSSKQKSEEQSSSRVTRSTVRVRGKGLESPADKLDATSNTGKFV